MFFLHHVCLYVVSSATNSVSLPSSLAKYFRQYELLFVLTHIYNIINNSCDPREQPHYLKREQVLSSPILNTPSSLTLFLCTVPPKTLFIICNTQTHTHRLHFSVIPKMLQLSAVQTNVLQNGWLLVLISRLAGKIECIMLSSPSASVKVPLKKVVKPRRADQQPEVE